MSALERSTVGIAKDVAWTSSGSRMVVMDLKTPGSVPRVLEASAAAVWQEIAIDGPLSLSELLDRLGYQFDTDPGDIRSDVDALISDLIELRLLEV